jgi:uncharacterized protein YkvS
MAIDMRSEIERLVDCILLLCFILNKLQSVMVDLASVSNFEDFTCSEVLIINSYFC